MSPCLTNIPLFFLHVQVLVGSVTGNDAYIKGRRIISLNQLDLTDIKVDLEKNASQKDINSAAESAADDFAATGCAKKKAKKALRASLTDLEEPDHLPVQLRESRQPALASSVAARPQGTSTGPGAEGQGQGQLSFGGQQTRGWPAVGTAVSKALEGSRLKALEGSSLQSGNNSSRCPAKGGFDYPTYNSARFHPNLPHGHGGGLHET